MNYRKITCFVFVLAVAALPISSVSAQKKAPVNFGSVKAEDFNVVSALMNENANAVIIADVGTVNFEGNAKGQFTYVFKRQTRIKLLNNKAFDLAKVNIRLYSRDNMIEQLEKVSASAYNIENNIVTETKLNTKDIYEEKLDKNNLYKKFAVPGIKEGSIIEYSYIKKSDFAFNLPSWEFQSAEAPVLWSEYDVNIPTLFTYMTMAQGYHDFFINDGSEGFENYTIRREIYSGGISTNEEESLSISSPVIKHRWVKKDLPVFMEDGFVFSSKNFIDKLSFQLNGRYDGRDYHDVRNNWGKVYEEMMRRDDFGLPLQQDNPWLDDILKTITTESDSKMDAAKKIYTYMQANYTCTDQNYEYLTSTLRDVVKKKNGSVGDINLLLAALLKRKGITVDPVVLSTREYGRNVPSYPMLERLNYVVCKATINSSVYYLDATRAFIPFGRLPLNCYNGHARVLSVDTAAVYFTADSLMEKKYSSLFLSTAEGNAMTGTYKSELGYVKSIAARNSIANTSESNYLNTLKTLFPDEINITDMKVDAVALIDKPVEISCNVKLNSFGDNEVVYFTPMLGEALKQNPFHEQDRLYPVEMPYKIDETFVLTMEVPANYSVEELPKQVKLKLNEDDGFFEYLIDNQNGKVQLRCRLKITKTLFSGDDYYTLRDFYAYIVKKEAESIVFKKIK